MAKHSEISAHRANLSRLDNGTTTAEEARIITSFVHEALKQRKPLMSLAALFRHSTVDDDVKIRLKRCAAEELRARLADVPSVNRTSVRQEGWLGVKEASQWLARDERTVADQLHTVDGRRRLGWPWWDGHAWRIAPAAVDPNRRAAFMESLPASEPTPDLLPQWCERADA